MLTMMNPGKANWQCQTPCGLTGLQISHHHPCLWRGSRRRVEGGLCPVQSSSEFAGSTPNVSQNFSLPSNSQRLGYVSAGDGKPPNIIDLRPQGAEPTVYSVFESSVGAGRTPESSQFSFGNSYSGERIRQRGGLSSFRRLDTSVRAERVSKRSSEESSGYRRIVDDSEDEYGDSAGSSVWDSNAENIRRPRFKKNYYTAPEEELARPRQERNGFRQKEWDYDSEPRAESKPFQPWSLPWQWWNTDDDGNEDFDEEDEDEEVDDPTWLPWLRGFKDTFMYFRWGLPALFLLGSAVIPTMIGNPLLLLLGFTVIPSIAKYVNPLAKGFLGAVFSPSQNASKGRRQRSRSTSASTTRRQGAARYNGTQSSKADADFSRVQGRSVDDNLGGWDDLLDNRSKVKPASKWPLQKRSKTPKNLVLRQQPFYMRVILALFPFLRGWGGLL